MATSQPDVINATLGAAFGGVVGPILDSLINGLRFVCQCPRECKALGEALERIQPSLKNISAHCRQDPALEKWLNVFGKCVEDARVVLQKCENESHSIWNGINKVRYGGEVLELRDRIKELVNEASLLSLSSKSSSFGIIQDVPRKIFGMEDHFTRVKSAILEGHKGESWCVGIRGMGGAGKTLLAQMVNNDEEIHEAFGKDSVIWITVGRDASISEIYNRMRNRLQVCSDGGSLKDQRTDLMNAFATVGALLILDNVWDGCIYDNEDMVYWLNIAKGSKSVTLITTRDDSVTCKWDVVGEEIILRLSQEQSWQLFCTHAFGMDMPTLNKDLEAMARDVCEECDCLPLALRVIGCAMKGNNDWRRMLRHMQTSAIPDKSIEQQLFERLRFSYDRLDGPSKICFLYFAAFPEDAQVSVDFLCQLLVLEGLFGEHLDEKEALDDAHCVVNVLVRRSLIEVIKGGTFERVKMHDILRDLASQLASEGNEGEQESLFKMVKKDLEEFPKTWLGYEMKVKRLSLWGHKIKRFPDEFLAPNLKICILHGVQPTHISNSIGLGSYDCKIQENFFRDLYALKFLQISRNPYIRMLPQSIGRLKSLQQLNLLECKTLEQLPESIGGLRSLQHLNLSSCKALKQLPESIGGLQSLQHFNLSRCGALEQLPKSIGRLESLQYLNLSWCGALEQLPKSIGGLRSLQHLDLLYCRALKQLPKNMGGLEGLQYLDLSCCEVMKQLPENMGGLASLQVFNLSKCRTLKQLPESMERLGSLQYLNLSWCGALEHLPESMGGLGSLQHLNLLGCEALEQLLKSMGRLRSLQHLNLSYCEALEQLPESVGGLGSLQFLDLSYCRALEQLPKSIGGLESLQHLNLLGCELLKQLPKSMGRLGSLQYLDLSYCEALEQLPESMGGLGSLQHLNLSYCGALEQLPKSMGGLESLQHLNLRCCEALEHLPENMGGLGSLQYLDMACCEALEHLPESMGGLGSLQYLNLSECQALEHLPESMGGLRSLQHLNLKHSESLVSLPYFTMIDKLQILFQLYELY